MARTILARRTWDQGKESLWVAACRASASRRAIVNLSGRRPRIRAASHAVRADRQHRRPVEFIARVVSGDTRVDELTARMAWHEKALKELSDKAIREFESILK